MDRDNLTFFNEFDPTVFRFPYSIRKKCFHFPGLLLKISICYSQ
jgi:hypothetical protein